MKRSDLMKKKSINKRKHRYKEKEELPKAVLEMKSKKETVSETDNSSKRKGRKKDTKLKNKKLKKALFIIITIIILFYGIKLAIYTHNWKMLAKDMSINENSIVKDLDEKVIAKIGSEKKKKVVTYDEIPNNLKNAYIAIEDERYYSHHGVDLKRTASAIGSYIIHFGSSSFGGSTLTQQLVKNMTGDSTESISRKINEWWKAWQLETCLSKEEILETYFNIIYVGPSIYGVEAGSKYYFNKSASELSLEECAFLAGINHSPNSYNPFNGKDNKEKIIKRTHTVLDKMKELNYIDGTQYDKAISNLESGLNFKEGKIETNDDIYTYHTDALISEITEDIAKKFDISETFATNYINMAGLNIYSTQDSKVQKEIETEFKKKKYILNSKKTTDTSQSAMVIINHKDGSVVGCVGGLGEKKDSRVFNRATQSIRQTGSAIKPIAVLAPAIDKKIITAASIYDDTPKDFGNDYYPTDYSKSLGNITVRRAVESSQNVPFVLIMEKLKPKTSIKYLEKMGITTLTKKDESLPLSLGGLEKGISPLEMAGAYSTIANDGEYIEPTFYSKIERKNGDILVKPSQDKRRVFSKEVAYILKELLTQPVLGENGTATYCKISGVDVAAKTGTTDENYDRWLCGFTPYYTAVTWFGFDKNESIEFNQRNPAGLIWANVMSRVHTGLNSARFEKPYAITTTTICAETGEKATTGCKHTYTEYFLWFTEPGLCSKHSGTEIKYEERNENNKNNTIQNNVTEIIKGITDEIDEKEPPRDENTIRLETRKEENKHTSNDTKENYTEIDKNNSTKNKINNNSNVENSTNSIKNTTYNTTNTTSNNINNNNVNNNTTTSNIEGSLSTDINSE